MKEGMRRGEERWRCFVGEGGEFMSLLCEEVCNQGEMQVINRLRPQHAGSPVESGRGPSSPSHAGKPESLAE